MKVVYSKQVKAELEKLKEKNLQRHNQILKGVLKIELMPFNVDNLTHDLNGYWCEKAGPQVRLFYKILHDENKLFLSWVNPEEFPHDTNNGQDRDPCYKEFTRLLTNGLLESYQPEKPTSETVFEMSANWSDPNIYFKLIKPDDFAESYLNLQLISSENFLEYDITHFGSKSNSVDTELELLLKIVEQARGYNVSLTYFLYKVIDENEIHKQRSVLARANFQLIFEDQETETWQLIAS